MPVDGISSPICFKGSESFDFIRSIHSGRKSRVWVAKIEEDVMALILCVFRHWLLFEAMSR